MWIKCSSTLEGRSGRVYGQSGRSVLDLEELSFRVQKDLMIKYDLIVKIAKLIKRKYLRKLNLNK